MRGQLVGSMSRMRSGNLVFAIEFDETLGVLSPWRPGGPWNSVHDDITGMSLTFDVRFQGIDD